MLPHRYYGHTHPEHPHDRAKWEPLFSDDRANPGHIQKVRDLAVGFAGKLFPKDEGLRKLALSLTTLAALWHDLGKCSEEFAQYLIDSVEGKLRPGAGKVDHSTFGAQHALKEIAGYGHFLSFAIAGHHSGLPDQQGRTARCLKARLGKTDIPKVTAPNELLHPGVEIPNGLFPNDPFAGAMLLRMIFSCLIDADRLATESFMSAEQSKRRQHTWPTMWEMEAALEEFLSDKRETSTATDRVKIAREAILSSCLAAAEMRMGFFSLTAPTGGGKTLSSLAFALKHARINGCARVIYTIPFTSIIEQNADVFRSVFKELDPDSVLEHHSNFDVPEELRSKDGERTVGELATENWDAPLVVTTNVQFFESLLGCKTSSCRKLHNIANSVIVLDEAQAIPVTHMKACLRVLKLLVESYGCTVVICTATQPAFTYRPGEFEDGLKDVVEILTDPAAAFEALKRVEVMALGQLNVKQVSTAVASHDQVLCIVSTRRHASHVFKQLCAIHGGAGCYHLSRFMCPEQIKRTLARIRRRLERGLPCRVVSTQLIEAGVDVDFPVVYRSLAGLDSIVQAAGRCNREGHLELGTMFVFRPDPSEHEIPLGELRSTSDAAAQIIPKYPEVLSLDAIKHYFRLYYWKSKDRLDAKNILRSFSYAWDDAKFPFFFQFQEGAEKARFIENEEHPIIIPYNDQSVRLIGIIRSCEQRGTPVPHSVRRRLQRFSVSVPERMWREAMEGQYLEVLLGKFAVLKDPLRHYSEELGLEFDCGGIALQTKKEPGLASVRMLEEREKTKGESKLAHK